MDTLDILAVCGEYLQGIPIARAFNLHFGYFDAAHRIETYLHSTALQSGRHAGLKPSNAAVAKVHICKFHPVAVFNVIQEIDLFAIDRLARRINVMALGCRLCLDLIVSIDCLTRCGKLEPVYITVHILLTDKGKENIARHSVCVSGFNIDRVPFAIGRKCNRREDLVAHAVLIDNNAAAGCALHTDRDAVPSGTAHFVKLCPSAVARRREDVSIRSAAVFRYNDVTFQIRSAFGLDLAKGVYRGVHIVEGDGIQVIVTRVAAFRDNPDGVLARR